MKPTSFDPNDFCSTEEFHKGYRGEDIIARLLRQDGYYVVIMADYNERGTNGAPGARNGNSFITLPDIQTMKNGYSGYVEVKSKYKASYTRKTRDYEHGIGLRKWRMYQRGQENFGLPFILCIYEISSGKVLFQTIDKLKSSARYYHGNEMDKGGMVFFRVKSFIHWATVTLVNGVLYRQLGYLPQSDDKLFKVIKHHEKIKHPSG